MTPKERVWSALRHEEPDRVPLAEFAIDYPVIEDVLGRETFCRAHFKEVQAYWDGRRDEVVESYKRDTVEFALKAGLDAVQVGMVPPKGFQPEVLEQIDEETWRDWRGNTYRYSALTKDLMLMARQALPPTQEPKDPWEPPAEVDESELELINHVVQELGDTHFIFARMGRRLACGYPSALGIVDQLMAIVDDPEGYAQRQLRGAQGTDEHVGILHDLGVDTVCFGHDYGHNNGPFVSPEQFRQIFFPAMRARCEPVRRRGLPVMFHSCGDNRLILDQMIEAGMDCYQAIQPEEDIAGLKRDWGDRLTLWGGVASHTLSMGSEDEVRQEVRHAVRSCAPGGGFIMGASHSVMVSAKPG
ncbi:MAG: uroporphyrinogen decarboxylase family protein, partial [Armatimonadota bacterium]